MTSRHLPASLLLKQEASPRLWNQLPDSFRQPRQSCLDSPPHSPVSSSLLSSPLFIIHHSFTVSLQAQNLPFQQILSTIDFFYLLDCLTITGLDRTGPITLIILFLVLRFNFLFVLCGRLSWLPVSFLLHVKHTLSYRCIWDTWISELFGFDVLFELVSVIIWVLYLATCVRNWLQLSSWIFQIRCAVALESWV